MFKQKLMVLFFAVTLPVVSWAGARPVAGDWQGTLSVQGTQLRIVFHVVQNEDGGYTSTMDSPDQGALGLAVAKTTFEKNILTLDVAIAQGRYKGTFDSEKNRITGTWTQGPYVLPLVLKPVEKAAPTQKQLK